MKLNYKRYILRGTSDQPQGLAGVPRLASSAYEAMTRAAWRADDSPAAIPVHDYDRAAPGGDAFKAVWGYDADARTEQGACGAVCYSLKVPAAGASAGIVGVTVPVIGDRYLAAGAIVTAIASMSATPPAWADVLAASATSSAAVCVPDPDAAPNVRGDTSDTVEIDLGGATASYIHVVLRCADYLATRGAWYEGGAMVADADAIDVEFEDDVEADADDRAVPLPWIAPGEGLDVQCSSPIGCVGQYITFPSPWCMETITTSTEAYWLALAAGVNSPLKSSRDTFGEYADGMGHWMRHIATDGIGGWTSGGNMSIGARRVSRVGSTDVAYHAVTGCLVGLPVFRPGRYSGIRFGAIQLGGNIGLRVAAYAGDLPPLCGASTSCTHGASFIISNIGPERSGTIPAHFDFRAMVNGELRSLPFFVNGGLEDTPATGGADTPIRDVGLSLLGKWDLAADIAAGAEFRFTRPFNVEIDGAVYIAVTPYTFLKNGAQPSISADCLVSWPVNTTSLVRD